MSNYVFGANILENLTTGMYKDSKVIYREYIQNAADQIDKAEEQGILQKGEGEIQIWLDSKKRIITIEDNATGISANDFVRILGNIADSDKIIGQDKGFRGIGRLCGLAYCKELRFISSAKGETIISTMTCNAKKMRDLITESNSGQKHTAEYVLMNSCEFSTQKTEDTDKHFFKVEMIEINEENTELFNFPEVNDYLSFVAPVPYQNTFLFRKKVYNYAEEIGTKIDEYKIKLDGTQIFKKYNTDLLDKNGNLSDKITDIEFQKFYDSENNLIAWMWFGLSAFSGVIPQNNKMRNLRLRKENIQIGDENALKIIQKEESRGINYFVGEIFAVSKDLIPNSQRDFFNENPMRILFVRKLKDYFENTLFQIYQNASKYNSALRKEVEVKKDFQDKKDKGLFIDENHLKKEQSKLEEVKSKANELSVKAHNKIKKADSEEAKIFNKVFSNIREKHAVQPKETTAVISKQENSVYLHDKLSQLNESEKNIVSQICKTILDSVDGKNLDKQTANFIITKIQERLLKDK